MPMQSRFSTDERAAAVTQARVLILEQGYSQSAACRAVAEDIGVSERTVALWALDLGDPLPAGAAARAKTAKAKLANVVFHQEQRNALSDAIFRKVGELLERTTSAKDLKDLSVAYAVLVEKRRLEESKPTAHVLSESSNTEPSSLAELATGSQQAQLPANVSPLARRS